MGYAIGRRQPRETYPDALKPQPTTAPSFTVVGGNTRPLQSGVVLPLLQVDMSQVPDQTFSARLQFSAECADSVTLDAQIRQGDCNSAVALKPPNTFATSQAQVATNSFTAGNMTTTFSWSTVGTVATLNVTVTTTLANPAKFNFNFNVIFASHPEFAIL